MWYIPNAYENIPKYNSNTDKTKGPNLIVRGSLSAILAAITVDGFCCKAPEGPCISDKIDLTELQPYQKEFLKQWKAQGKPYMFKNHPEAEKYFLERGCNTRNLTDAQALEVLEYSRDLARLAGIKLPEDF